MRAVFLEYTCKPPLAQRVAVRLPTKYMTIDYLPKPRICMLCGSVELLYSLKLIITSVVASYCHYITGVIFDQLDDRSIEYTIRLRQPSNDSWDTGSRGSTTQLGPRTSK